MTPAEALAELVAGNQRFVTGSRVHPNQDAEHRAALADAQRPFAIIFGCSDSRLAAEIVFDRGLGDLFVVRTAGHITDPSVLASLEYGVTVLNVPLIVVLGHDRCGAIQATQATLAGAELPTAQLQTIVDRVAPSLRRAQAQQVTDPAGITAVHIRRTMDLIARQCAGTAAAVAAGTCAVVGMSYRLTGGAVTVLAGSSPAQPGPGVDHLAG